MRHIYRYKDNAEFEEKDGLTKCLSCNRIMEGKVDECTNPDCPGPTNVVFEERVRRKTTGLCGIGTDDNNLEIRWEPDVEDRITCIYYVPDTNAPITLLGGNEFLTAFTEMRLDTGELISPLVSAYTFDKTGYRTVYFTLKENVTSLAGTFQAVVNGRSNLVSIQIPSKIRNLGSNFCNHHNGGFGTVPVFEVYFSEGLTGFSLTDSFSDNNITRLKLPNTLTHIANGTFEECKYLKEIVIPDKVKDSAGGSFAGCTRATRLILGSAFQNCTGPGMFSGCSSLNTIIAKRETPPSAMNKAFQGVPEEGTLYIPANSPADSKTTSYKWKWMSEDRAWLPSTWTIVRYSDFDELMQELDNPQPQTPSEPQEP